MKNVLRIALISVEYPTLTVGFGGLAANFFQAAQAFRALGHEVEVFLTAPGYIRETVDHVGVTVHHVPCRILFVDRVLSKVTLRFPFLHDAETHILSLARSIAAELEKRETERGEFDFVLATSLCGLPLYVKKKRRPIVVFCTSSRELHEREEGLQLNLGRRLHHRLLRYGMWRADKLFSNSHFYSDYYKKTYGIRMDVLVPPILDVRTIESRRPPRLPNRYLMHHGLLGRRKGSDVVAKALPIAWEHDPELNMVWAGGERDRGCMAEYRGFWGGRAGQVNWLGPIPRSQILGALAGAVAAVVPSRADNIPNSMIESLTLGIPVIGSDGASIDEVVEHGRNGWLVPIGDAQALAEAMVCFWRGEGLRNGFQRPKAFDQMEPHVAAQNLIDFALK